jgi:predicted Zn finger-like uncharacterized protein
MEAKCPHCGAASNVDEADHYKLVTCAKCGKKFQAFSARTEKLSKEFLDRVLGSKPDKDSS